MSHLARDLVDRLQNSQPPNKQLGQHFLINEGVLDSIIASAQLRKEDHILEIGPGPGVLTQRLMQSGATVSAVEIDAVICDHLRKEFPTLNLTHQDALMHDWPREINAIVANIPYQISSPLVEKMTQHEHIKRAVIMVQEEFAHRLNQTTYSDHCSLGMVARLDWKIELAQKVPPHFFSPQPKVQSRIVLLSRIPRPEHWRLIRELIQHTYAQRRKKIRNTLRKSGGRFLSLGPWKHEWNSLIQSFENKWMDARPEELGFDDWCDLATKIIQHYHRCIDI